MESSVAEIHEYSLRPGGFEEPLFRALESRREVIEHLLRAPWLSRASELAKTGCSGKPVRARRVRVEIEDSSGGGRVWITLPSTRRCSRRCSWRRLMVEVLARWREVGWWWDEERATDRIVVRLLLSDGAVVDLARERSGEWFLVGVVD